MTGPPDEVHVGPCHVRWDPDRRVLRAWLEDEPITTAHATRVVARLREWVGDPDPAPYGLVVDATSHGPISGRARGVAAQLCRDHLDRVVLAPHHCSTPVRITVLLLQRLVPGLDVATFDDAAQAEAHVLRRLRGDDVD